MTDTVVGIPTWILGISAVVSPFVLGILGWATGRRAIVANARKANAEAFDIEVKTRVDSAAKIESNRNDFERVLNDRTSRVMDSLETQVAHLTELVELQNKQLAAQGLQMQQMEFEIRCLRDALGEKSKLLQQIQKVVPLLPSEGE